MLCYLLMKENILGVEFRDRSLVEEEVHLCEEEQGLFLDKEDEEEERLTVSVMNYLESSYQHDDVLKEEPNEASRTYIFKYDNFCMIFRTTREEVGQSSGTIMNIVEYDEEVKGQHLDLVLIYFAGEIRMFEY
jgi:hypothetical protein